MIPTKQQVMQKAMLCNDSLDGVLSRLFLGELFWPRILRLGEVAVRHPVVKSEVSLFNELP